MYICINTPNEIVRSCTGTCTLMDFFLDQVLTVNKIYGTCLNISEFFGTNVNTCITF